MTGLIILIASTALLVWILFAKRSRAKNPRTLLSEYRNLLMENVAYYRALDSAGRQRFEVKIMDFLSYVRIHGVSTTVEDLDKVLIASSAVIPIFGFEKWHYYNLRDVLLYEDAFDAESFSTISNGNTLGMVGTGAMQRMMILSKPALREGFKNEEEKNNTGIHEFVHLLDYADGSTDGIPEQLLHRQYTIPWLKLMNETMDEIIKGKSDMNIYGASSKKEFFAVAAEYFFQRPELFKERHAALYELMEQMFNQYPVTNGTL